MRRRSTKRLGSDFLAPPTPTSHSTTSPASAFRLDERLSTSETSQQHIHSTAGGERGAGEGGGAGDSFEPASTEEGRKGVRPLVHASGWGASPAGPEGCDVERQVQQATVGYGRRRHPPPLRPDEEETVAGTHRGGRRPPPHHHQEDLLEVPHHAGDSRGGNGETR